MIIITPYRNTFNSIAHLNTFSSWPEFTASALNSFSMILKTHEPEWIYVQLVHPKLHWDIFYI